MPVVAEAAVSISVLSPLLGKITGLLHGQYGRPKGIRREILSLRSELTVMNAALKDYSMLENPDSNVKQWMSLLRELAYDAEDVFDKFIHHHGNGEKPNSIKEFFRQTARGLKMRGARRKIAEDLKACIKQVRELKTRYKLDSSPPSPGHAAVDPRLVALYVEEAHLVGVDGPRDDLAKWILEGDNTTNHRRRVLSIVGFGGLGKTTLANVVYRRIRSYFHCWAFVSVSRKPDIQKIINHVIYQVSRQVGLAEDTEICDENASIAKLRELLQDKRYLIIIDDIWSTPAWDIIQCAFPENNRSSVIIATTRIVNVAKSCCATTDDRIYEIEALSHLHAKELFFKRIFGSTDCCPDMLEEISNKILKKCGGLPLAIISISGLLAHEPAVQQQWEHAGFEFWKKSSLHEMSNIISLSYNDLPPNLKTCLLYLSAFPEDYVIERERLVKLWIAEGFLSEVHGQSQLEVAEQYFHELINRNIIQPVDIGYDGKVRACRVHVMMLEVIISKSTEDNFMTVVRGGQTNCLANHHGFIRRLSIQHIDQQLASALENEDLSHVRSLTVSSSVCIEQLPSLKKFEVLRVLDFEGCEGLEEYITSGMSKLFNLKYLRLKGKMISKLPPTIFMLHELTYLDLSGTNISSLPSDIQMLHDLEYLNLSGTGIAELPPEIVMLSDLQYLDLRNTCVQELPAGITKLIRLQHLHISSGKWTEKGNIKVSNGIGSMRNLQAISGFNITDSSLNAVEEFSNLTSLSELHIQLNHGGSDEYKRHEEMLLSSLCTLGTCSLRSLWIHKWRGSLEFLDSWFPPPLSLQVFRVSGDYCFTNIPKWIVPALRSLVHLEISLTELRDEGLHTLGELPALLYLKLSFIADPTERITVQCSGFPDLKKFVINSVAGLYITFMEGAMPKLQNLNMRLHVSLAKTYGFHLGLQHLSCLKELAVSLYEVDATRYEIWDAATAIRNAACIHPNRPRVVISGECYERQCAEIDSDDEDFR